MSVSNIYLYFIQVYNKNDYLGIVGEAAEKSMQSAVDEVKALPDYDTKGEVCDEPIPSFPRVV